MESVDNQMISVESLQGIARTAWFQALRDFYHPPLPEPEIEHDKNKASYFYIDPQNWRVHLNTVGVPLHLHPAEAESYLRRNRHP